MGGDGELNNRNSMGNDNGEVEEIDENPSTLTSRTRIFVGGLGGTLTVEDLCNTFSSLGKVDLVEIVRSKGRSFAYFDFLPFSEKSLAKLFSTYNGCLWKGGRLKLEKAKQHYLLRLKQEWREDAEIANSTPNDAIDVIKSMGSPEKLNNMKNLKMSEVRLFFPKLGKLKSLPFSGSGKHKYSFQRAEVPALPTHFCDCDEHSEPLHTAREHKFSARETQDGGIDEKELNIMESVMNKLFEKENNLKAASSRPGLVNEGDNATKLVDDLPVDESEADDMTDEDNLVLNMVAGGWIRMASLDNQREKKNLDKGEEVVERLRISKDKPLDCVIEGQRSKILPSDKRRKSPHADATDGDVASVRSKILPSDNKRKSPHADATNGDVASVKIEGKRSSKVPRLHESAQAKKMGPAFQQSNVDGSFSLSRDVSGETRIRTTKGENAHVDNQSQSQNQLHYVVNLESQPSSSKAPREVVMQTKRAAVLSDKPATSGALWQQKSSWTQLVGGANSSFSIAQLLPGMSLEKQEQVEEPKSMFSANLTVDERGKTVSKPGTTVSSGNDGSKASLLSSGDDGSKASLLVGKGKSTTAPYTSGIGETCTFMRSAASVREWKNTKAAISGSLKKKRDKNK